MPALHTLRRSRRLGNSLTAVLVFDAYECMLNNLCSCSFTPPCV